MNDAMNTGDLVIGVLAGLGVIVLLVVFFFVVRMVFFHQRSRIAWLSSVGSYIVKIYFVCSFWSKNSC